MSARGGWLRTTSILLFGLGVACAGMDEPNDPLDGATPVIAQDVVRLLPGHRQPLTLATGGGDVAWTVLHPGVATIDAQGVLRAQSPGMTWAYAVSGVERDSARVVVSFANMPEGAVAFSLGQSDVSLQLQGAARVLRSLVGRASFTRVHASTDPDAPADLHFGDFFNGQDTLVVLHLAGEPAPGFREIAPWDVTSGADSSLHVRGFEGALIWMRVPDRPDHAALYVPVTPLQLEIDVSTLPNDVGPATGRLAGRVSFDAAGLLLQFSELGTRIVGQVSQEVVPFFAEFDLAQRIEPMGAGRLSVTGGPVSISSISATGLVAGIVNDGLVVQTGNHGDNSGAVASAEFWVGTPTVGDHDMSDLRIEELFNGTAYSTGNVWAWTQTGTIANLKARQPLPNLALTQSGTLRITRFDPPGEETWGQLDATLESRQYLIFGGAPGATQSVTFEMSAPVAPLSMKVYTRRPDVPDDWIRIPGSVRVSNGTLDVHGRVHALLNAVPDVEVTLKGDGGAGSVRTNENGQFLFTGVHPGQYEIEFAVPPGYTLSHGQSTNIGPFDVTPNRNRFSPVFIPIDLADAAGNGMLIVAAYTTDPSTAVNGLTAQVRAADSNAVVTTIVTRPADAGDPRAVAPLQPGRYSVDFTPPTGYEFANGQPTTVEIDVLTGRIASTEVFLVKAQRP